MILVHEIRQPLGEAKEAAFSAALSRLRLRPGDVASMQLHRVSVDARRGKPQLVYSVALQLRDAAGEARFAGKSQQVQVVRPQMEQPSIGSAALPGPVVIAGLGPAGLFAALELARAGYAPLVLERGPDMTARRAAVVAFEKGGPVHPDANIQFGEGGAGTFSDGKLTTRINDPLSARVMDYLISGGAPPAIALLGKPHIGTDRIGAVFTALREQMVALGGNVRFGTKLEGIAARGRRVIGVQAGGAALPCGVLVLACGHSARDTYAMLHASGVPLEAKPFSVGLRVEHLQSDIDAGLYHEAAGHPALPPGEYQLSARVAGQGVYTFCMCPGGTVVAAASEEGGVVTNGMSTYARGGPNANSAVVASVAPGGGPFGGIALQRRLERRAFQLAGGSYAAPAATLGAFMAGEAGLRLGRVQPSYPRGVCPANLDDVLGGEVAAALRGALQAFGRKLPGFMAPDAVLTAPETRTSSPLRVPRGEGRESAALSGLWPCGEGAGYAGGIMSAAVDGIRTAWAIMARYAPPV